MVYPEDTVLLAGDSVIMTCVGTGVPTPTLTWQKNGEDITGDGSKYFVNETLVVVESTVFVRSTLRVCNASEMDVGEYSCTADSAVQGPNSEKFNVTVQSKSKYYH